MFDHYEVGPRKVDVNKNVTVKEHRAPTDESVRLLREMEAAAREAVVAAYVTEPNQLLHAAAVRFRGMAGDTLTIAFRLNGKDHRASFALPMRYALSAREVGEKIRLSVADAILGELALPVALELR